MGWKSQRGLRAASSENYTPITHTLLVMARLTLTLAPCL